MPGHGTGHRPMPDFVRGSGGAQGRPAPRQGYGVLETSGLPGRQGMADQPHPMSARLFGALVKKPSKKLGTKPSLSNNRGLPAPFHRNDSVRNTGVPTRFGPVTGRRSF